MNPSCSTSAGGCWGWIGGSGGRTTRRRGAHGFGFISVEGVPSGGGIDCKHHPAGTVVALSTVHPDRSGVVNANGVSGEGGSISADRFTGGEKVRQKRRLFSKSVTYNPELKPFAMGLQGLAKVDWVAVWFFTWNSKVTVSPGWAVRLFGWKVRTPVPPTITL